MKPGQKLSMRGRFRYLTFLREVESVLRSAKFAQKQRKVKKKKKEKKKEQIPQSHFFTQWLWFFSFPFFFYQNQILVSRFQNHPRTEKKVSAPFQILRFASLCISFFNNDSVYVYDAIEIIQTLDKPSALERRKLR